jgi:S1-C subfamily serine protease
MIASDKPSFEFYGNLGHYARIVHVACTLQSGTSGGPWLDARGRIVGQQSGIMSSDGVPVGVAFMAPVDAIGALLAAGKSARTPTLGMAVEETWQQERDLLAKYPPGTEGLFLRVLVVDGPAARAGLEDWDLIVAADGKPVRRVHELLEIVRKGEPGRPLTLQVRTPEGERVARQVKLGHLEAPWSESVPAARPTATP